MHAEVSQKLMPISMALASPSARLTSLFAYKSVLLATKMLTADPEWCSLNS